MVAGIPILGNHSPIPCDTWNLSGIVMARKSAWATKHDPASWRINCFPFARDRNREGGVLLRVLDISV